MADYIINWTDDSLKAPFSVASGAIDTTTTALAICGKSSLNWGERLQENLIRLLENFASSGTPPVQPTIGQLWFNDSTRALNVYYNATWNKLRYRVIYNPTPPSGSFNSGDLWYDTTNDILKVLDNTLAWVTICSQVSATATPTPSPTSSPTATSTAPPAVTYLTPGTYIYTILAGTTKMVYTLVGAGGGSGGGGNDNTGTHGGAGGRGFLTGGSISVIAGDVIEIVVPGGGSGGPFENGGGTGGYPNGAAGVGAGLNGGSGAGGGGQAKVSKNGIQVDVANGGGGGGGAGFITNGTPTYGGNGGNGGGGTPGGAGSTSFIQGGDGTGSTIGTIVPGAATYTAGLNGGDGYVNLTFI
jgi:hypothetical protein